MTASIDNSRVWFITGASKGLGRALAEAVLDTGERVLATARDVARSQTGRSGTHARRP